MIPTKYEYLRIRTDGLKLPVTERLWKYAGVKQPGQIPLGCSLGLKIPEEPALGLGFEGFHLCFDVTASVILVILYQEQEPTYVLPGNVPS